MLQINPKKFKKIENKSIPSPLRPKFRNKDFIVDLSGALEDQNGKKDINKIDKLLNLFEKL